MTSGPPRPPSSTGPDRLICEEWPESPPYLDRYDVSIELHRDAARSDSNQPGAFIFWQKPKVIRRDIAFGQLLGQLPWGLKDIPSRETSPTEVPAWDACGFQKLLGVFPYSRQSLVPQVRNYKRQSFWFGFRNQFRNGKYLRTFEVGSIFPDSVLFILF